jgi:hypothetical protein
LEGVTLIFRHQKMKFRFKQFKYYEIHVFT